MSTKCEVTTTTGLWAPLTCGREKGHTGMHIHFEEKCSIGFEEESRPTEPAREWDNDPSSHG